MKEKRDRFFFWLAIIQAIISSVESVPLNIEGPSREVSNNSLAELESFYSRGCRYKALFYTNGEEVSTDEPCLACQCKGTAVVCKLRICPEIPVPPPPGCIVVHKAKSCCSQLICHGQEHRKISREQRFPAQVSNETVLASISSEAKDSAGFCVLDGTVYAEGSAMRSSTLCQYCFCIRGEMKCSSPQCVIPLNGCKPKFRSYACCPTNYDCGESNETAILKTLPSSTQVPQFLKGCLVNGQFVPEGEPVLPVHLAGYGANMSTPTNVCQTCFCMGGVVHCRPLECDKPIDGCVPIKEDGHCCPDRYDCSKASSSTSSSSLPSSTEMLTSTEPYTSSSTEAVLQHSSTLEMTSQEVEQISTNSARQVHEGNLGGLSATTVESFFETTDATASANEDSFERIASMIAGSSEESTVFPVTQHVSRVAALASALGLKNNRSDILGSREERRSKDADEQQRQQQLEQQQQQPQQMSRNKFSIEDDERDEQGLPYQNGFETTVSNAIEELAATTVFDDVINESTQDPEILEGESSSEPDTTSVNNLSIEKVTENYVADDEEDLVDTTLQPHNNINDDHQIHQHEEEESTQASTVSKQVPENDIDDNDDGLKSDEFPGTTLPSDTIESSSELSNLLSTQSTENSSPYSNDWAVSEEKISTTETGAIVSAVSTSTPIPIAQSSSSGNLEFIPFVEEDARVPVSDDVIDDDKTVYNFYNEGGEPISSSSPSAIFRGQSRVPSLDTSAPVVSENMPVLKPLELKFLNNGSAEQLPISAIEKETNMEDALPIIVEKEQEEDNNVPEFHNFNVSSIMPVSTSLYNNGYYQPPHAHGQILKDGGNGPEDEEDQELFVSHGTVESVTNKNDANAVNINDDRDDGNQMGSIPPQSTSPEVLRDSHPTNSPDISQHYNPAPVLPSISHSMEEFIPSYNPPPAPSPVIHSNPVGNGPIFTNPTRTYSKFGMQDSPLFRFDDRGAPVNVNSQRPLPNPIPPTGATYHHRYYNEPEVFPHQQSNHHSQNSYNYYNTYINKEKEKESSSISKPQRGQGVGFLPPMYKDNQFFYEDSSAALDSYEDYDSYYQSSSVVPPSTPPSTTAKSSSSITKDPSLQFLRERLPSYNQQRATSTPKYKYAYLNNNKVKVTVQSKPTTEKTVKKNEFKPLSPFPFNLPRNQENIYKNLGIKLSGCNVVGKMYSVGEIIEELSSDCLRCMCSDIGVHCGELQC